LGSISPSYEPVSDQFDSDKHLLYVDKDTKRVYMTERGLIDRWSLGRKILSLFTSKNYDLVAVHDALINQRDSRTQMDIFPKLRERIISRVRYEKKDPKRAARLLRAIFVRLPSISITRKKQYQDKNKTIVEVPISWDSNEDLIELALTFASAGYIHESDKREYVLEGKTYSAWYDGHGKFTFEYNEKGREDNPQTIQVQLFNDSNVVHLSHPPHLALIDAIHIIEFSSIPLNLQDFHQKR